MEEITCTAILLDDETDEPNTLAMITAMTSQSYDRDKNLKQNIGAAAAEWLAQSPEGKKHTPLPGGFSLADVEYILSRNSESFEHFLYQHGIVDLRIELIRLDPPYQWGFEEKIV